MYLIEHRAERYNEFSYSSIPFQTMFFLSLGLKQFMKEACLKHFLSCQPLGRWCNTRIHHGVRDPCWWITAMDHLCATVLCNTPLPGHKNNIALKEVKVPGNLDFFFKFERCYQRLGEEKWWWINWTKCKGITKRKTKSFLGSDSYGNLHCILKK